MQETSSAQKNKWGPAAYLWTAIKEAFGWQPYHFNLHVDGQDYAIEASELVIANARKIGVFGLEWRDSIAPDDGRIDIAVVRARSLVDYTRLLITLGQGQQDQSAHIHFYTAKEEIRLEAEKKLPIHGDGEMLETDMPVTAVVVPKALTVITPSS
jgi:diacylglycerol kinase family enzyme